MEITSGPNLGIARVGELARWAEGSPLISAVPDCAYCIWTVVSVSLQYNSEELASEVEGLRMNEKWKYTLRMSMLTIYPIAILLKMTPSSIIRTILCRANASLLLHKSTYSL